MKTFVVIKTTFAATHNWPDCDIEGVLYLKHEHRHLFYVTMKWAVNHADREIEFIQQKMKVDNFIKILYTDKFLKGKSCEMMAKELLLSFEANYVSVFEDNENGAEVHK